MPKNYEITMKVGDTGEPVRTCVRNSSDGKAPDWSDATVKFIVLTTVDGVLTEVLDKPAGVELPTASSGALRYDWGPTDTTDIGEGRHRGLFKVTKAGGPVESYPREGYIWINIEQGDQP